MKNLGLIFRCFIPPFLLGWLIFSVLNTVYQIWASGPLLNEIVWTNGEWLLWIFWVWVTCLSNVFAVSLFSAGILGVIRFKRKTRGIAVSKGSLEFLPVVLALFIPVLVLSYFWVGYWGPRADRNQSVYLFFGREKMSEEEIDFSFFEMYPKFNDFGSLSTLLNKLKVEKDEMINGHSQQLVYRLPFLLDTLSPDLSPSRITTELLTKPQTEKHLKLALERVRMVASVNGFIQADTFRIKLDTDRIWLIYYKRLTQILLGIILGWLGISIALTFRISKMRNAILVIAGGVIVFVGSMIIPRLFFFAGGLKGPSNTSVELWVIWMQVVLWAGIALTAAVFAYNREKTTSATVET